MFSRMLSCICPCLSVKQAGIKVIRDFVLELDPLTQCVMSAQHQAEEAGEEDLGLPGQRLTLMVDFMEATGQPWLSPCPHQTSTQCQQQLAWTQSLWVRVQKLGGQLQEIQHQGYWMQPRNGPTLGSLLSNDVMGRSRWWEREHKDWNSHRDGQWAVKEPSEWLQQRPTCKLPCSSEVPEKRAVNRRENTGLQHQCCPWRTRPADNGFLPGKGPAYLVHEIYPGKLFVVILKSFCLK